MDDDEPFKLKNFINMQCKNLNEIQVGFIKKWKILDRK